MNSGEEYDEPEFQGSKTFSKVLDTGRRPVQQFLNCSGEPVVWDASDEYDFSHPNRGSMIIFNNEIFKKLPSRTGTEVDATSLERTFSYLGFKVDTFYNQTREQMLDILKKASKTDHSESDCFVCAVLSHVDEHVDTKLPGRHEREDIVYAFDNYVLTKDIVNLFDEDKCKTLRGKPKIFLVQACRGNSLDTDVNLSVMMDEVDDKTAKNIEVTPCPIYKDCLLMYASPPGFYAFRHPETGSWFVRAVCEVLNSSNLEIRSLNQLFTSVIRRVGLHYQTLSPIPRISGMKQTPCIITKLVKDVYLRSKEKSTPV